MDVTTIRTIGAGLSLVSTQATDAFILAFLGGCVSCVSCVRCVYFADGNRTLLWAFLYGNPVITTRAPSARK